MDIKIWNKETYKNFIDYLRAQAEEKYKVFHQSLCKTKYEILGIRLPILRKIAKEIIKGDFEGFLNVSKDDYYEEVMIYGLVTALIKDEAIFNSYFLKFIEKVDNWALCDTFCNSIKIVEKYPEKYFELATKFAKSQNGYKSRVGLVTILSHFVNSTNLHKIYEMLNTINSNDYYINMAEAWLVCELYIKFKSETLSYLNSAKLNKFTFNKSISKICDSYRISKSEKEMLKNLRK